MEAAGCSTAFSFERTSSHENAVNRSEFQFHLPYHSLENAAVYGTTADQTMEHEERSVGQRHKISAGIFWGRHKRKRNSVAGGPVFLKKLGGIEVGF